MVFIVFQSLVFQILSDSRMNPLSRVSTYQILAMKSRDNVRVNKPQEFSLYSQMIGYTLINAQYLSIEFWIENCLHVELYRIFDVL